MNRSWRNTSTNSSTGFIYFNTSNSVQSQSSQNSLDTSEFLSFGSDTSPGTPSHGNYFSPSNYSSPRNHYAGKSPRQRGGRNQYYSPIKQTGGKFWRKNMGLTGPADRSINNTSNSHSYHENRPSQNRHNQTNKQGRSFHHNSSNQRFNTSVFYDSTCLRDPWAELEEKLADDRKKENESLVARTSSQSMDVNAEGTSSDDSDSKDDLDDSEEMEESVS